MAVLFVASAGIAFAVRRHQLRLEEADRNWRELMDRKPGREQIEAAEREAAQKEYELKLWLHSVDPENEAAPEPPQSPQLSSNSKK